MKYLFILVILLCCSLRLYPQGLKQWTKQKETEKKETAHEPSATDRLYLYSIVDNKVVFTGFETISGISDETIFINALLWAITHSSKLKEDFSKIDYSGMNFTYKKIFYSTTSSEQSPSTYTCESSIRISNDMISFLVTDIIYESTGALNIIKRIPFEKLDPEKKAKHIEYLNEFTKSNSGALNEMFDFIRNNKTPSITHWEEITQNKVTKGMNQAECTLAYGKPIDIKTAGNKEQWMYGNSVYLFFEDGILASYLK